LTPLSVINSRPEYVQLASTDLHARFHLDQALVVLARTPESAHFISPSPALRKAQARTAYVLLMLIYLFIFSDFCQPDYLNVHRTDLH